MNFFKNINFDKLKQGLSKTREKFTSKISEAITGKARIDENTIDDLEEILISSDIGFDTTTKIIEQSKVYLKEESERDKIAVINAVKKSILTMMNKPENDFLANIEKSRPFIILVVGVNGAGKTTTIGKLAHNFRLNGLKVLIGSADTFRAAANDQLEIWAKRANVEVVHGKNYDPSSVAYDTIRQAIDTHIDIVLIDTAGRLHTKQNLMDEMKKIDRTIKKLIPNAPNEIFLVLDGNTGQNGLLQAEEFSKAIPITGLIITKLDGTAKGGSILQINNKMKIPIRFIGVGEDIEDLQNFDAELYVDALFKLED